MATTILTATHYDRIRARLKATAASLPDPVLSEVIADANRWAKQRVPGWSAIMDAGSDDADLLVAGTVKWAAALAAETAGEGAVTSERTGERQRNFARLDRGSQTRKLKDEARRDLAGLPGYVSEVAGSIIYAVEADE